MNTYHVLLDIIRLRVVIKNIKICVLIIILSTCYTMFFTHDANIGHLKGNHTISKKLR